jgi:hypothetical protein
MKKGTVLKRLYIIVVLAVPLYWLMLTDDGHRFTDTTILKLSGGKTMDIHLKALNSSITEKTLQQQLPDTPFSCNDHKTLLGDHLCQVKLASFNGIPARFAIAYFADDHLQALKVGYQRPYHRQLLDYLFATRGKPGTGDHISAPGAPGFYRWHIGDGELVILDEQSLQGEEPALLWKTL